MWYNVITVKNRRETKMSKKWLYEKELNQATQALLTAYLAASYSKTLAVIFTMEDGIYYCDLNNDEIAELARVNGEQLMTQKFCKKRAAYFLPKAVKFATTSDMELVKSYFPKYRKNAGYIAEFLYRLKVTGETVEEIKSSNNSKPFDKGNDTKDGKQLKNIDNGATFTSFNYLLEVCEKNSYEKTDEVKKAIEFLTTIYSK